MESSSLELCEGEPKGIDISAPTKEQALKISNSGEQIAINSTGNYQGGAIILKVPTSSGLLEASFCEDSKEASVSDKLNLKCPSCPLNYQVAGKNKIFVYDYQRHPTNRDIVLVFGSCAEGYNIFLKSGSPIKQLQCGNWEIRHPAAHLGHRVYPKYTWQFAGTLVFFRTGTMSALCYYRWTDLLKTPLDDRAQTFTPTGEKPLTNAVDLCSIDTRSLLVLVVDGFLRKFTADQDYNSFAPSGKIDLGEKPGEFQKGLSWHTVFKIQDGPVLVAGMNGETNRHLVQALSIGNGKNCLALDHRIQLEKAEEPGKNQEGRSLSYAIERFVEIQSSISHDGGSVLAVSCHRYVQVLNWKRGVAGRYRLSNATLAIDALKADERIGHAVIVSEGGVSKALLSTSSIGLKKLTLTN